MDQRVEPNSRFSVSLKDTFCALNQGRHVYFCPPSLPMTNSARTSPKGPRRRGFTVETRRFFVGSALLENERGASWVGPHQRACFPAENSRSPKRNPA